MTQITDRDPGGVTSPVAKAFETNGINTIAENERKGRPRDLFWPWFAANVSVLAVAYGSFLLGFNISFWQTVIAIVVGCAASYVLVGFIAVAGKRASAPTMTISRSVFGIRGNRLPAALSWLLTVGWETVLTIVAALAVATIFRRLGWGGGDVTKMIALVVVVGLIMLGGLRGFDLIMRMQKWITLIAGILTAAYIGFSLHHVDVHALAALPTGTTQAVIGATLFTMTGFGLGWVNAGADYSRYLPRTASARGIVGWTTLGAALPPFLLLIFGALLAGSSADLNAAIAEDPIGALTTILPTWFLLPFAVVTVVGLVAGAVMDIYSSGLSLLNVGLRVSRTTAVLIDAAIMAAGAIGVVFFSSNFLGTFEGFLITLGVPVTAWCGIFVADIALRRGDYSEADLFNPRGRYGDIRWIPIGLIVFATVVGWGLVTNTAAGWLDWQGYLLGPFGLGGKDGAWAYAQLGVIVALIIGFVGYLILCGRSVRIQDRLPLDAEK